VALSAASPAIGWRARARAHKVSGYSALHALGALHAVFFRGFDVALVKERLGDPTASAATTFHPLLIVPAVVALVVVGMIYARQLASGRDRV